MFFYFGSSGGGHRFGPPAIFLLFLLASGWLSGPTALLVVFIACCVGAWQVKLFIMCMIALPRHTHFALLNLSTQMQPIRWSAEQGQLSDAGQIAWVLANGA